MAHAERLLPAVVLPAQGTDTPAVKATRSNSGFQPAGRFSRSQQAFLRIAVAISGRNEAGADFREETTTVILLPQGAVVHMEHRVRAGDELMLFHSARQQEVTCRVFGALPGPDGKLLVEIEFNPPQKNLWPVSFPAWAGNGPGNALRNQAPGGVSPTRSPALTNSSS